MNLSFSSLFPTGSLKLGFDSVFKSVVFAAVSFCFNDVQKGHLIKRQRFLMSYVIACYQGIKKDSFTDTY